MDEKLFQIMRFQILSTGLDPAVGNKFDDAYLHAWDNYVYPVFHHADWHKVFGDHFKVSEEMPSELLSRLGEAWQPGQGPEQIPTFYDLEDIYGVRDGRGPWDRNKLINAVRYVFLSPGNFDDQFYRALIRNQGGPSEANSFMRPYERKGEIFFI